jgi:hypothetical protein
MLSVLFICLIITVYLMTLSVGHTSDYDRRLVNDGLK